ncbi:MAG TPA: hypothetical protein V6C52_01095 [Coleofasciculaceae cyanobacterium]|jgi:pectate lyase
MDFHQRQANLIVPAVCLLLLLLVMPATLAQTSATPAQTSQGTGGAFVSTGMNQPTQSSGGNAKSNSTLNTGPKVQPIPKIQQVKPIQSRAPIKPRP